ncbi:MAG TPA: hypothetical protein DCE44_00805, partial [Verrucomicrobiales bacterium]|nr:hypothetical protein [Verrucomicrobiales bacterium]
LGLTQVNTRNYAVCGSTSADIYNQVASRLFAPSKPELCLYALGNPGADFLRFYPPNGLNGVYVDLTNQVASTRLIDTAVLNFSNAVQRLYQKGARSITYWHQTGTNGSDIVALGSARAGLLDGYTRSYNAKITAAMEAFGRSRPDVRLYPINLYVLWNDISTNPTSFGFTETTANALGDPRLRDKSFSGPGADYLWWDRSHATSKFHGFIATSMFEELTNSVLEQLEATPANATHQIQMNHLLIGRDYTLQGSPNLNHWQDLQTFTASAGTNQWMGAPNNAATIFYRLKW